MDSFPPPPIATGQEDQQATHHGSPSAALPAIPLVDGGFIPGFIPEKL